MRVASDSLTRKMDTASAVTEALAFSIDALVVLIQIHGDIVNSIKSEEEVYFFHTQANLQPSCLHPYHILTPAN